jgi:hypothetical protein
MNTITTPAPVRTDASPTALTRPLPTMLPTRMLRLGGAAITALVAAFAVLVALPWPPGSSVSVPGDIGALAFQLSTLLLLVLMWRTHAVGEKLIWRGLGALATVIVVVAMACMLLKTLLPTEATLFAANVSWMVAMAGMFIVSVGVVARGQWRAPLRYLPLIAHSWPLVVLPVMVLTEDTEGQSWFVYISYLCITQALLGLMLAVRPRLTGAPIRRGR